jgi:hypothetical protein
MWKISRKVLEPFYQFSANKIALVLGLSILLFLVPNAFTADSTPRTEVCPNVWVEVTPAFFPNSPADHTYVRVIHRSGATESWPCFGADTGGNELDATRSSTHDANLSTVGFLANQRPCKWPKRYYAIVGVCHQLANRSLYHTSQTVKNARWYKITSFIYGTYGICPFPFCSYRMSNCLQSASGWETGIPPVCDVTATAASKEAVNEEAGLYKKYFDRLKGDIPEERFNGIYQAYINDLMDLYIKNRLGPEITPEKSTQIKAIRNRLMIDKQKLDETVVRGELQGQQMVDAYNGLYNKFLDNYREILDPAQFYNFFGLDYETGRFDIGLFTPR